MQVVAACAKAEGDLVLLAKTVRPQVAVLSLHLEWDKLRGVVTELSRHNLTLLLMSDAVDKVKTVELLLIGANGIISPQVAPEMLYKSVRAVAAGEIWISRRVVAQLVRQIATPSSREALVGPECDIIAGPSRVEPIQQHTHEVLNRLKLTPREVQIVQAMGDGLANKDIAATFGISEYTVKHHLTSIFDKVGVDNRLELAMFAIYHGLVETADASVRQQSA
jgi:DNA-binding NarL/FixJ family response regulator